MKINKKKVDVISVVCGDDISYTRDFLHLSIQSKGCYEIIIKEISIFKSVNDYVKV